MGPYEILVHTSSATASSRHSGSVNVCMMDGSVKSIKSTVARNIWAALGTNSGSEVISADAY